MLPNIAIIGAGPAGLMAAQTLAEAGMPATVFDAMPSAARKFLQAGRGGLNLTHDDTFADFVGHYYEAQAFIKPALQSFTPQAMRDWAQRFGFETFVGSSGKVYPLDKKAAPLLRAWLHELKQHNTQFKMNARWIGWQDKQWTFATREGEQHFDFDAVILALGGASWPHLGATGSWVKLLAAKQIRISALKPANMGFNVVWSAIFKEKFAGQPLKNVSLRLTTLAGDELQQLGELLITQHGVEGSLIYTHSKHLRAHLEQKAPFTLYLDLFPHRTVSQLSQQLAASQGKLSLSAFWKRLGLEGIKASLIREVLDKAQCNQPGLVASTLKNYPLVLQSARPLEEAISTAGGISFSALDADLMLQSMPGVFCAGEMVDWEAPTGGYLLTGVMAQGKQAAQGVLKYLHAQNRL